MEIHYIAQYGENPLGRSLEYSPAGVSKMKYIIEALKTLECPLKIYSTSRAASDSKKFYRREKIEIDNLLSFIYCATFGSTLKILRLIERLFNQIQLFFYLLFHVKKKDIVVIYHERYYLPIVNFITKIKEIIVIYEVENLYISCRLFCKEIQKK